MPLFAPYEIEISRRGQAIPVERLVTRAPMRLLQPILGVADAWYVVGEADKSWKAGNYLHFVEFEDEPHPGSRLDDP